MNLVISREYVEKNYIHKDRIKEKIKNIEKEMEKDKVDEFGIHSMEWRALDWLVDYLKREILGKENDGNK